MSAILLSLLFVSSVSHASLASSQVTSETQAEGILSVHACFKEALQDGKAKQAAGVDIDTMDAFIAKSCQQQLIDAENNNGVTLEQMARLLYNVQQEQ
ncbi:hypothetical protein DOE51_18285 [Bdellovibrio sp. NC01]|nr:hypothetical protein DOE51_18285 [Bdellovibrio sp. NC01]